MAEVQVTVRVPGGGGVADAIDAFRERALRLKVVKSGGACPLCVANNDPDRVPLHVHCRCSVTWVED